MDHDSSMDNLNFGNRESRGRTPNRNARMTLLLRARKDAACLVPKGGKIAAVPVG